MDSGRQGVAVLGTGEDGEKPRAPDPIDGDSLVAQLKQVGLGVRDLARAELYLRGRPLAIGELEDRIDLKAGPVAVVMQVTAGLVYSTLQQIYSALYNDSSQRPATRSALNPTTGSPTRSYSIVTVRE